MTLPPPYTLLFPSCQCSSCSRSLSHLFPLMLRVHQGGSSCRKDLMENQRSGIHSTRVTCHHYTGINIITDTGISVLGSSVGSSVFTEQQFQKRVASVKDLLSRLPSLEDAHFEYSLLQGCLSMPKISYTLRTLVPADRSPSDSCQL